MRQHLGSHEKQQFKTVRTVLDEKFNKSACLDLESFLIRMFSGDGKLQVLNRNAGIIDANYFDRDTYRKTFQEIFDQLRNDEHLFTRTIPEIINSDLFKLSPFKALNHDQATAVEDILEGLFSDIEHGSSSTVVVQGNPGTGKTVVAIYLLKLIEDIRSHRGDEGADEDSLFSDFFTPGHAELLSTYRIGIVVPQQSLRDSLKRVFTLTPGLSREMVLTPFEVGQSAEKFDLLLVDEAHRLGQRANQASGPLNKKFADINLALFGTDNPDITQLDWIQHQCTHTILMLDIGQSVRPADLSPDTTQRLLDEARQQHRFYPLRSQMRIAAEQDYVGYIRSVLGNEAPAVPSVFDGYDLRFFDDLAQMRAAIQARDSESQLARLVAGYAWPWKSKADKDAYDISIDNVQLRWNSTQRDWINSQGSSEEVGSIHTVQGYDLNYAAVIIGHDLQFDPTSKQIFFSRENYYDKKGRENNPKRGIVYSDEDLLRYVQNIYTVLLTRGIRGTYVYVCNPELRHYLRPYFSNGQVHTADRTLFV